MVIKPNPPIWIMAKITACPNHDHCVAVSATTSPVTQVEEVAVNKPTCAFSAAGGNGQGEEDRPQRNDRSEGAGHDAGRVQRTPLEQMKFSSHSPSLPSSTISEAKYITPHMVFQAISFYNGRQNRRPTIYLALRLCKPNDNEKDRRE